MYETCKKLERKDAGTASSTREPLDSAAIGIPLKNEQYVYKTRFIEVYHQETLVHRVYQQETLFVNVQCTVRKHHVNVHKETLLQ